MWGTQRDVSSRQLGGAHHQESKHLPAYLSWDFQKAIREDPETSLGKKNIINLMIKKWYDKNKTTLLNESTTMQCITLSFWVPTLSKKEYIYTRPRHANLESVSHKENMQFTISRSCSQILMTGRISTLPACKFIITHYCKLCAISVILYSGRHDRALQRTSALLLRNTTYYPKTAPHYHL